MRPLPAPPQHPAEQPSLQKNRFREYERAQATTVILTERSKQE